MATPNILFSLLSREGAGFGVALLIAVAGALVARTAPAGPPALALHLITAAIGLLLAAGALRQWILRAGLRRRFPPPGRLVDIGGQRLHLLAEGEGGDLPSVLWIPGAHAGAFALHHLHRALRVQTRSILLDRPGTGWSDVGPFPRSTAREADELVRALEAAGERGPFVFAGHSFGGLLAANIARRRPELVHTVVLIDPTPLDVVAFGPQLAGLSQMRRQALLQGALMLFGIHIHEREEAHMARNPSYVRVMKAVRDCLGPEVVSAQAIERTSPGASFASASIYTELNPHTLADCAWDTAVYDGDLGDLPVVLIAPGDAEKEVSTSLPEFAQAQAHEARRMARFFARARERYLAASSRSERVLAPDGSGHNFPFTEPDFLIAEMRRIIQPRRGA